MGEPAMILDDEQLEKIGEYVKSRLHEWLPEKSARELDLLERFAVIETELKNLGQRMDERFEAMDARFDAMLARFEVIDARFEAVNQRFEAMQRQMDYRFDAMQKQMDERFNAVDRRFVSMQWFMGIGFTVLALLMSVYQYL